MRRALAVVLSVGLVTGLGCGKPGGDAGREVATDTKAAEQTAAAAAEFGNGKSAIETVAPHLEKDGTRRVVGLLHQIVERMFAGHTGAAVGRIPRDDLPGGRCRSAVPVELACEPADIFAALLSLGPIGLILAAVGNRS